MSTSEPQKKPKAADKLIGQLLAGKYKILKKIGEGGMGSVYIATQEPIDRKVAVKVLLGKLAEDQIAVKRFEQEARAISKMQHPNTVTIYDFGSTDDGDGDERLYIVMEFLKGQTLTQALRADGQVAPARACRIIRQVCASLADAHAAGIIHRDLKPDNIFLTEIGGDKDWVKVLDFGVAKLADSEGAGTLTQTGMIFGTPKYMSPEQAEGRAIDHRADIYALGVVLFELLVGRPPFVSDTPVGLLLKHISEPPPPFARIRPELSIDPRLEAVVMKALDKRPERRHQGVLELASELDALERALTGAVALPGGGTMPMMAGGVGMPTEMVPGAQPAAGLTPAGLMPPNAVPANLSLGLGAGPSGLGAPTGGTLGPDGSAAYRSPDGLPTAAQGVLTHAGAQPTAPGLTHPMPSHGAADTLGGVGREISGGHLPQRAAPNRGLLFGGLGLLGLAGGLVVMVNARGGEAPTATALMEPEPAPAAPAAVAPAPAVVPDAGLAEATGSAQPRVAAPVAADAPRSSPGTGRADPAPRGAVEAPVAAPVAARTVTLRIGSEPAGAMVLLQGKQLGSTPLSLTFPKELDVLSFSLEKKGFEKGSVTLIPNQDREETVKLVPRAEAPRPADPAPAAPPARPAEAEVKPASKDTLQDRVDDLKTF